MTLSEKTWIYALCLQLLLSDGLSSVASGLSGLLAGYLYMSDDVKLQNFRLPSVVEVRCVVYSYCGIVLQCVTLLSRIARVLCCRKLIGFCILQPRGN